MFSIYTSLYNLSDGFIDWEDALTNFCSFADEVVIATFKNDQKSIDLIREYAMESLPYIKVVPVDIDINDIAFDGKLKNAALKACTQPFCILLDADEFIPLSTKDRWIKYTEFLSKFPDLDGFFIPSVNLCRDVFHYKDIGYKIYLHKNSPNLFRGIVNYARTDNHTIDINKSDTTELIDSNGNLAKLSMLSNSLDYLKNNGVPYVFHKWAIDFNKRIAQNNFWEPVWSNRAGKQVNHSITREKLEKIEVFCHNLEI